MTEKELFEATYRALYPVTCENTPDKFEWLVDHYSDSTVHVAWRLWRARADIAKGVAPGPALEAHSSQ